MPRKAEDINYMKLALELAEKGRGKTRPNPMVGAVIVKNGKIIGQGYHRAYGREHAETVAIRNCKGKSKGSTLYVNLEPCCHTGNTGPCTKAVIEAGIKKVVIATKDPNPLVNGKGIRILKKAGIETSGGVLKEAAFRLNDSYYFFHANRRPFVILKQAQSLDGRIATSSGESKYISSENSLRFTHGIRSEVDAVVIGGETFKTDNPSLTVRFGKGSNPYRVILSQSVKLDKNSNLIKNNGDSKTIIATTEENIDRLSKSRHGRNMIYWVVKTDKKGILDISDFVKKAGDFGIRSMMVEGGAALATSFLKNKLVDKIILISSPILIGEGISAINNLDINRLKNVISFKMTENIKSGCDNIFIGYPEYR